MPGISASHVSKILREAGVPKASPYKVWGRERDGFAVIAPSKYVPSHSHEVAVVFTGHGNTAAKQCDAAQAALTEAGYIAMEGNRNGLGGTYRLTVTKEVSA